MISAPITRQDILSAMVAFDAAYPANDYDNWREKGNYKRAVRHNRRYYPCKWLIVHAMGDGTETPEIHTGEAIRVLKKCKFEIVAKP